MYWIYMIINNIDGNKYIGYSRHIDNRMLDHARLRGGSSRLTEAIKKYGLENFLVEVLEYGMDDHNGLTKRESFWIQTLHPEYNLTDGGEGILNYSHTLETRRKISQSLKNRPCSHETRRKISRSLTGKKRSPLTPEQKHQISIVQKNRPHSREHNAKISYTLSQCYDIITPTGEIIKVRGITQWAKHHKLSPGNLIQRGYSKGYRYIKPTDKETNRAVLETDPLDAYSSS